VTRIAFTALAFAAIATLHLQAPRIKRIASRAFVAARIRWVQYRIQAATDDADRLANEIRCAPRQLALWRGYVADRQSELQRLVALHRQL
jgi:hypothetical protein